MTIEAKHLREAARRFPAYRNGCCAALADTLREDGWNARPASSAAYDALRPFAPRLYYDVYWWRDQDGDCDFSRKAQSERQLFLLFLAAAWDDIT